jgi:DNA polymerase-3 subunit alpha
MKNYIPLHAHSHDSLLDGLSRPEQIAARCKKIAASACALTDHGTISGTVKFHNVMKKAGIKPILGCELYISDQDCKIKTPENRKLSHLVVLAKNKKGWKNLIKIVSESNKLENLYYKPRLDLKTLGELVDGNLIAFAGHLGSTLSNKIMQLDDSDWKNQGLSHVGLLTDIFGKENFFLEAQLMDKQYNPDQVIVTEKVRELAKLTGLKVICTPDAHYAEKSDSVDQRILLCNNLKTTIADVNKKIIENESFGMDCFFRSDNYHILDSFEMSALHTEEEIENTNLINSMIELYDVNSKPLLPSFPCPPEFDQDEYLRHLCRAGWKTKIDSIIPKEDHEQYVDRIKMELGVLQGAGLSSYFLILQDVLNYVRQNNWLPGPGRGSAAGCLVSYLVSITAIDPIKYDLMFERFYNSGRNTVDHISLPDIDVDIPIRQRGNIINYIKDKYGHDKVSQMITFNKMKGRGAIKDVLRVYGNVSFAEMNEITKFIPDESKISDELQQMKEDGGEASIIRWALENNSKELSPWCQLEEDGTLSGPLSKRFEQAIRLEGTKTNQSKHAAGLAISSTPLAEICPMIYDSKTGNPIAGMEMADLESLGIVKMDILGVAMLDKMMAIRDMLKIGA